MKLLTKRLKDKKDAKRRDSRLPRCVGPEISGNEFVIMPAIRVGARSGARPGVSELFVEFDDHGVLMLSAKPLDGFFNPVTRRLNVRPIFNRIVPVDAKEHHDEDEP
jgi:hypothetical protein